MMNDEFLSQFHISFQKSLAKLWVVVFIIYHSSFTILHAQQLPFRTYTTREGLLSNVCYFFFQDRDGYLWVSTESGLSRFDGRHFTNYEKTAAGKLLGVIISFAQTADGHIWAGGNGNGLFEFDGKDFRHYDVGDLPRSGYVTALLEVAPNVLLVGTEEGLFELKNGKIRPIIGDAKMMRSFKFSAAGSLYKDATGQFWGLFDGQLRRINPTNGQFLETVPHPDSKDIFDWATLLNDGRYVVGCNNTKRVYVLRDGAVQYTLPLPDCSIGFAVEDCDGYLWISTNKGLLKTPLSEPTMARGEWVTTTNGLPSNFLSTIFLDSERNLWFGSYGRGIYKLEETETYRFSYPFAAGLGCADEKGRLWFSTPDGLRVVGRSPAGGWSEQHLEPFPNEYFKSMGTVKILPGNQIWLGCDDGTLVNYYIEELPKGKLRLRYRREIGPRTGFPSAKSIWMFFDSKGRLWYSDSAAPNLRVVDVSQEKPRLLKTLPFDAGVRLSNGREIMEDAEGNFWFAYENNNVLLFDADLNFKKTIENIPENKEEDVNCLHFDRDGALWFGTQNHGLIRQTPDGRKIFIGKEKGLLSNRITHIVEGPDRTLWIATWHGLAMVRYSGDSLRIYEDREITQSPIWSLGMFPDGTGWVATNFDVVFHKSRAFHQPKPSAVSVRKLLVNGIERPVESGLQLSINENDLVLEFGTVSLQSRYSIRFQHKLEVDGKGNWSQPSDLESVNFAGLKPGKYRFLVKAVTSEGLESPEPASFDFEILPPFWQRWWFMLGSLLGLGAAIWFFVRQRIRRLLEIERLRARIAADLHDDIGSGLTRIALASEVLLRQKTEPAQTSIFQRIGETARELVEAMSDIVWAIDPQNDSLGKAADRIRLFANDLCEAKDIQCGFDFDPSAVALKPGSGIVSSLVLISKEAVNNAVRHAQCSRLTLKISIESKELRLLVQDDGKGFDEGQLSRINGLTNMRRRAEKAGGQLEIQSSIGNGTTVEARLPLV